MLNESQYIVFSTTLISLFSVLGVLLLYKLASLALRGTPHSDPLEGLRNSQQTLKEALDSLNSESVTQCKNQKILEEKLLQLEANLPIRIMELLESNTIRRTFRSTLKQLITEENRNTLDSSTKLKLILIEELGWTDPHEIEAVVTAGTPYTMVMDALPPPEERLLNALTSNPSILEEDVEQFPDLLGMCRGVNGKIHESTVRLIKMLCDSEYQLDSILAIMKNVQSPTIEEMQDRVEDFIAEEDLDEEEGPEHRIMEG